MEGRGKGREGVGREGEWKGDRECWGREGGKRKGKREGRGMVGGEGGRAKGREGEGEGESEKDKERKGLSETRKDTGLKVSCFVP